MLERYLSRCIEWIVITIAAVVVAMVSVEVLLRYVFGQTLYVTEELTRYLMVWLVFLGTALAVRDGSHIHITLLTNRLSARSRYLCKLITHLLVTVFCVILVIEGIRILPDQLEQMAVTINVSIFWFYLAIPTGATLVIVFLVPKIKEAVNGMRPQGVDEGRAE